MGFKKRVCSTWLTYWACMIIVIALALFTNSADIRAATWTVPPGGDIQGAIDNASDLDTIILELGLHALDTGKSIEIKGRNLTIRGQGALGGTVVQGDAGRVFLMENAAVVLENLTITKGDLLNGLEKGAGICQDRGKLTLIDCRITENGSEGVFVGGGVAVLGGELIITRCKIHGNLAFGSPGIYSDDSTLTITFSDIHDNTALELDPSSTFEDDCEYGFWYGMGGGVGAFFSSVSISDTTIENNRASFAGGLGLMNSTMDLMNSDVISNKSYCEGGGLVLDASQGTINSTNIKENKTDSIYWGNGGGIFSSWVSHLEVRETIVSENESNLDGGGMYIESSNVSVSDSTISDNKAGIEGLSLGGGMAIWFGATVTISKSTVSGNSAYSGGGGIWVDDYSEIPLSTSLSENKMRRHASIAGTSGELDQTKSGLYTCLIMNNSTISGNHTLDEYSEGAGGGLFTCGKAYINFSTITGNQADMGGGIFAFPFSATYLGSSIVADNTGEIGGPDWYDLVFEFDDDDDETTPPVLYGPLVVSDGGNLIGINTDSPFTFGSPNGDGDYVGTSVLPIDPELVPLTDNGGPTETHALPVTSPALDAAVGCMDEDQRGYGRPYPGDGLCDIGAFEYLGTADLNLTKDVDNESPLVGDQITYTLSITNNGPVEQASGVSVTDLLPLGVTYVSDDGGGNYDPDTGIWTVGYLNVSQTEILHIQARVDQSGSITNTATADSATTDDSPAEDEAIIVAAEREGVALTLTKTVDDDTPEVETDIVYTLTVSNTGDTTAETVRVTDLLPTGLDYQGHGLSETYDNLTGVWTVGDLGAGGSRSLDITVKVTQSGTITNTATAFSSTAGANSPTAGVDITAADDKTVDLTLTKTLMPATALVGGQVVYTLRVGNLGPDQAEAVRVSDLLPTGLTHVSHTGPGNYDAGSGLWTVGDLNQDEYRELDITVRVDLPGTITNTATAFSSTAGANSPSAGVDITATDDKTVDLTLTKTVAPVAAMVGDEVVYTLTIGNNGPDQAENVVVSDFLPTGLSHVSDDGSGSYDPATGLWDIGDLDARGSRQLNITARVTLPGVITNTATAFSTTLGANSPTAGVDVTATEDHSVILVLSKAVDDPSPTVGDEVVYTLEITNNGGDRAVAARVSDLLPTGLSFVSSTGSGSYEAGTGLWIVGDLDPATGAQRNITAQVTRPGLITNTATAFCSTPDANSPTAGVDILATEEITVDLALKAAINPATPQVNDLVVCTLTIENNGPDEAENVQVSDLLPTGLSYESDNGAGSYIPATGLWTVGTLGVNESRKLEITARVTQSGTISNTAVAFSSSPGSNSPAVRVDITATDDKTVDLTLTKTVMPATALVGGQVVYTLRVGNQGPDQAEAVRVSDLLPTGLTHVSHTGPGNYDAGSGLWTVGDLNQDEYRELDITARVDLPGTITNTATAFSSTAGANSPSAGVDIIATQVCDVTLALTKTVDNQQPLVGDQVTYTLIVENQGKDPAAGVVVSDFLPTGLNYVSHTAGSDYTPATGVWAVGDLDASGSAQLALLAEVILPGTITNTATAFSTTTGSICTNASVDVLGTLTPDHALILIKTVNNSTPVVGRQVVFTLLIGYLGSVQGEGVVVTDLLPAGLEYLSDDGGESYNPVNGEWNIGNMNQYDTRQLHITARVTQAGTITNTATAASAAPVVTPVNASVDILAAEAVSETLGLMKSVDHLMPRVGERITYTLVVTNEGQDIIETVKVNEPLPEGLGYISDDSGGDFNHESGWWAVGDLDVAASRQLKIQAEVVQAGLITNTATAVSETNSAIKATSSAFIWGKNEIKGGGSGGGGCFVRCLW